jgi:hypothetical protein
VRAQADAVDVVVDGERFGNGVQIRLEEVFVGPITLYGVAAVTFMMLMYALESRGAGFILGFAVGCLLSSAYGFLAGAWPFGVIEAIWAVIAVRRFLRSS